MTGDELLAAKLGDYLAGLRVTLMKLQALLEELEQRNAAEVEKP